MKRPTNTPQSNPLKTGKASWWTGWTKPLHDLIHTLEADVAGLQARLKNTVQKGRPASYVGFRDFLPEKSTVPVNVLQSGPDTDGTPCNYIVRDGQDYDIPIIMPGPGVFVAEELTVSIFQQQYAPVAATSTYVEGDPLPFFQISEITTGAMQAEMRANVLAFPSSEIPYFTTKFSVYPLQTNNAYLGYDPVLSPRSFRRLPPQGTRTINFFWNMIDTKSQRRLADAPISQMVLTPPSLPIAQENFSKVAWERIPDGDLFRFCTPWVFERDGQANFTFRPITPVLQVDSSIPGQSIGLYYDDRVNGIRDQRVRVQVELHGYRYETDQDLIRAGVLTR